MLKERLITSFVLIAGFLSALFLLPDFYWSALMLGIIVIGAWEWGQLSRFSLSGRQYFTGLVALAGIALLPGVSQIEWQHQVLFLTILLAVLFWLILVPLWLLKLHEEKRKFWLALTGMLVLLATWQAVVHLRKASPSIVLALMAVVWIADSAAYFSGKAFGRHKLAPAISPGKTWEGVAGALVAVSIYGLLLSKLYGISLWIVVGFCGLAVLSVIGDLFESLLKRQAGLKDSGNMLPGHGGVLDRIDGLIPTLPLAAFYMHFPLYFTALYE